MIMRTLLALTVLLTCCACSHTSAVGQRAVFDLNCPQEQVRVAEDPASDRLLATGCGKTARYSCRLTEMYSQCLRDPSEISGLDMGTGPSGATRRGAAENRAIVELGCPEEKIEVAELGHEVYGAKGCGKRISYLCRQRFLRYWCTPDSAVTNDAD